MNRLKTMILKRPVALISLLILIVLYMQLFIIEFITPYTPSTVFETLPYHPPMVVWYSKKNGFGPQVQKMVMIDEIRAKYARVRGEYYKIEFFVRGSEYTLFGFFKSRIHLYGTNEPFVHDRNEVQNYPVFLFGSDGLGRDLFSRVLYGSRISLSIGIIAIIISLSIALFLGGIAGYYGGKIDWLIMRFSELFILIPGLYLILFIRSLISRNIDSGKAYLLITVILSFVSWPGSARLIRGLVHSIKREDFVTNAKAEGVPSLVILIKHIIPQMSSILIITITLGIPGYILGETILSYLGLGIVDPSVSWGSLISRDSTTISSIIRYPWVVIPGIYLLITTLSFNFIGEFLRDYFDPFHKSDKGGL
ncbi:MAG: hypothetical protein A2015_15190 [Spirochaetes bacterium GWF1_31_7]|nr:MAG: hypothetical protein A2Y30_11615 [Spirochaetes bacterium GWE1_32_154]OHD51165.1 MAG: hypothetical protein A2Y29_01155 [Spirochaetes bacterium GWE2_31_10]OHD52084.1 MAG: hypothetical protein A2015_15190 [Spirochaetes bacterium GWF1_31_7]OHD81028.1 MAG: hypothetical protein A2355_11150 [Spirochaetes bacterium RIFOXYB1_FULL_32_8]